MVQKVEYKDFLSSADTRLGELLDNLNKLPSDSIPAPTPPVDGLQEPHLHQILFAREEQLERLTKELDATNLNCLMQMETLNTSSKELESVADKQAKLQRELKKERTLRQYLQARLAQKERSAVYKSALSNSSVPVMVAVPDIQHLRPDSAVIPPTEFLAELKSEVETLLNQQMVRCRRCLEARSLYLSTHALRSQEDDLVE